jgi:hypothetical protein
MAVPSIKLIVPNPQLITDHQIDTESQINVCRDHATALSPDPFCLRSFEGRCQKLSAIKLKLAAYPLTSSVRPLNKVHGRKERQSRNRSEHVEDLRVGTVVWHILVARLTILWVRTGASS